MDQIDSLHIDIYWSEGLCWIRETGCATVCQRCYAYVIKHT